MGAVAGVGITGREQLVTVKTALGLHGQLRTRSTSQRATVLAAARQMLYKSTDTVLYWREDILWSDVQPTEGAAFDWTIPDAIFAAAADYGFTVWPILSHPPAWATAPGGTDEQAWPCPPYPGVTTAAGHSALTAYAAFCAAAADRYSRGGAFWDTYLGTPRPCTYFEVWNEEYAATSAQRWTGSGYATNTWSDPADYAAIFNAAAPAITASLFAVPVAAVCEKTWNSTPVGAAYLTTFLDNLSVPLPAVSVHPYTEGYAKASQVPGSSSDRWKYFTQVSDIKSTLSSYGYGSAGIWITEMGWPGGGAFLSESDQAARFGDLWTTVQTLGYVKGLFLFTTTNPSFPDNAALGDAYQPDNEETWLPLWHTGVTAQDLGTAKNAVATITGLGVLTISSSTGTSPSQPTTTGPCVLADHFLQLDGALSPQPWMQLRQVASGSQDSKSGSYAVAGGGNKNDPLHSITIQWTNNTPINQYVYGLVTRGGKRVALQARSRAYFLGRDGYIIGTPNAAGVLAVPSTALQNVSQFGCGLDVGNGGTLNIQTGFGVGENRGNSSTRPLLPARPGMFDLAPGQTIAVRTDVTFKSDYWEANLVDGGVDGSESAYICGDTLLSLYALPHL